MEGLPTIQMDDLGVPPFMETPYFVGIFPYIGLLWDDLLGDLLDDLLDDNL